MSAPFPTGLTTGRRWLRAGASTTAAVSALAFGAACAPSSASTADPDTITYVHEQEPPCIWGSWVQAAYTSRQVFDSLVSWDDDHPVPWLATQWSESDDRKNITFTLKEGVTFTDGTPFNADAVVANTEYWLKNLGWNSFSYITGATANSANSVTLHLSEPNPEIYRILANGHYGIQSPTALATHSDAENCQYPVGSGPWKVKKWSQGQNILFERNDNYDSAPENAGHQGPAFEKYLDWKFAPDANSRWSALVSGEAQAIYNPPASQWQTAEQEYSAHRFITGGRQQVFNFNVQKGPFTDVRVRQALAFATDRRTIAEAVFKGSAPYEANGALSPTNPSYLDVNDSYRYDPERAGELLDDAGWARGSDGTREKDGKKLLVRIPFGSGAIVSQDGVSALQAVQEQANSVGFKVELIPMTQTQYFAGIGQSPDEAEIIFGYWIWPAQNILDIVYNAGTPEKPNGNNRNHFSDPAIQQRILEAQRESDPTERDREYKELQQFFNEEAISVGFYDFTNNVVTQNNVDGFWQDQGSNGMPVFSDIRLKGDS